MDELKQQLKEIIISKIFVSGKNERLIVNGKEEGWMFDFRRATLEPDVLDLYTNIFFKHYTNPDEIQVGGMEVAAVPLVAGIVQKSVALSHPVSGFFVRKSRKKYDLMRAVEGTVRPDKKIILVDDILNSGTSIIQQVEVLREQGFPVSEVFALLRFRDESFYAGLHERGVKLTTLFELNDFSTVLPVANMQPHTHVAMREPFSTLWKFASPNPNLHYVIPKSGPVIDDEYLYFGSDSGYFWCLNQTNGEVVWKFKVPFGTDGKYIFSTPVLSRGLVIFGAYDGNLYALDAKTGKRVWTFFDADWIGSSPCVAEDLGLVFVGLEFGLFRKQGGIAAVDIKTGEKVWGREMGGLTHGSPAYSKKYQTVICGSNNGHVYAFDAKTGEQKGEVVTEGEVKYGIALDEENDRFAFGSFDGRVYLRDLKTGSEIATFDALSGIYSTPLFDGMMLYVASLDKNIYCFDVTQKKQVWKFNTSARAFASPVLIEGKLYVGSNTGRLYELDPKTGKQTGFLQLAERVVNRVAYNKATKTFFVPTVANEIYAVRIKP
ncbi:MAG TPA: PQQ-binding-like beta-propeller repeat protein [Candidatus Paceibacterota bacterium]|nr:PQQ-binding-like beta-propeller repeat protein [Candidatus Paceibacterota bacterium]